MYSGGARGAEEILVDEIAGRMGKDPVAFRREFLKTNRQRAVLDKVASAGQRGRRLPPGFAQGVGCHEEYRIREAIKKAATGRDLTAKHPPGKPNMAT